MRTQKMLAALAISFAAGQAAATCATIRVGYIDQHRPPYYLGAGAVVPPKAGASIELMREIAASAGCEAVFVRLPLLRMRAALESGAIDAMPMDASDEDALRFALPKDKTGRPDRSKAARYHTIVFVRTSDKLPDDTDPAIYFKTHMLGINHGASMVPQLQAQGYKIDEGALDAARNLEKLVRKRVDGYGASVIGVGDLDHLAATGFGDQVVRLPKPLRVTSIWLAFSKDYYDKNAGQSETMWNWIGARGQVRLAELIKKYENEP
ncbi:MAG: hypothetical protein V4484_07805 [Pseudomonadota bacterium]